MKYGIFFGSNTGTTENVARRLGALLGVADADIHDVARTSPSAVADYDVLLLGASTWGSGELQDDFEDFLTGLRELDLKGKKAAVFGCGDETMSDTFCDGVGLIYRALGKTGLEFIGAYPDNAFSYHHTEADVDGRIVGLLLDEVNHPDLTDDRLHAWAEEVKAQAGE